MHLVVRITALLGEWELLYAWYGEDIGCDVLIVSVRAETRFAVNFGGALGMVL
jgi:hypothetical protein